MQPLGDLLGAAHRNSLNFIAKMDYCNNRLSTHEEIARSLVKKQTSESSILQDSKCTLESNKPFEKFFDLEKLLKTELQHHFDAVFLKIYLEENIIHKASF